MPLEASPPPAAFFFPGPSLTALTDFYLAFEFELPRPPVFSDGNAVAELYPAVHLHGSFISS